MMLQHCIKYLVNSRLLSGLATLYLRLVYRTTQWSHWGSEASAKVRAEGKPVIVCFWHQRLLLMSYMWAEMHPMPFAMLSSPHRDARLAQRVIASFGLGAIIGTRGKAGRKRSSGAAVAFLRMLQALRSGATVGFTPDGPHGPRQRCPLGPLLLAQKSSAPLYPVAAGTRNRFVLNTWDKFQVCLPFGKGITAWGEPLLVPADADATTLEHLREVFEARMNALAASLDTALGHAPAEPA
jgi:lysophospholipid acyltransferase (LPLAT)-like uncharacterized protein